MNHDFETERDNLNENNGTDWYVEIWGGNIPDRAFENCTTLESVRLVDVEVIGEHAFDGCVNLRKVDISGPLKLIKNYAFKGCRSLRHLNIPDTAKLERYAFDSMREFSRTWGYGYHQPPENITAIFDIENGVLKKYNGSDVHIAIPEGVTVIAEFAFMRCEKAESVVIPDGVRIIANRAFLQCGSLQGVNIPDTVTVIGNGVFRECSLREITIPDTVEWLGNEMFSWCTALESVTLPKDLKVIPESMFRQCKRLQSITIPDGLREIEDYAFEGCESLRDIVIPDSVVEIGSYAFDRHSGITLRGKKGSEAERYAKDNGFAFYEVNDG